MRHFLRGWLVAGAVVASVLPSATANARAPAKHELVVLALPHDFVTSVERRRLLPAHAASETAGEHGMYFGPVFIDADHAGDIRKMTRTMPPPLKKLVFGRVGPWAMSGQPLGNAVGAGPAMYARF